MDSPRMSGNIMFPLAVDCSSSLRKFVVAVEGNIASGKTTFLKFFKNLAHVDVIEEPVKKWKDMDGHNMLGLLYEDPKRWSFAFQSYVQLTMVDNHIRPIKSPIRMLERSIFSARHCFVENLYRSGYLDKPEYAVLCEWFKWITSNLSLFPDLIVYLRSSPETVLQRIEKRGRPEEEKISLEYLQSLHVLHEEWLMKGEFPCHSKVMVLDANNDLPTMEQLFLKHKDEIVGLPFTLDQKVTGPQSPPAE
ncbi:unnamed protein product [Darwinula stevensoni]|uniref:Deoxynucleoside kinase domain-containing protein n=1 Tax=Darwinula stevensoni TaxID=69355 RepID=A0A7R9A6R8_9CRUS|nr:unnamed protein product [Darwinula stevensoni]CAG0890129.1 unnamed protein product [Darwinula stevensoni]